MIRAVEMSSDTEPGAGEVEKRRVVEEGLLVKVKEDKRQMKVTTRTSRMLQEAIGDGTKAEGCISV